MRSKMLVIVFTIDFTLGFFILSPFLTLSVRNGPSASFGTNVPSIVFRRKEL